MENRPVTKTSSQVTVTNQILTPQHMFALAIAGIEYLYISENDIAKNFPDFAHEEHYARSKTIPGTRSHHSFIPISEPVLEMKRLSLDVVGNQFSFQKRMPLPILTMACERFPVSNRAAAAAIAFAVLVDYGVITADQRENVIDKNKLRAQLPDFEKKLKRMRKNNLSRLKELGLMFVKMPL